MAVRSIGLDKTPPSFSHVPSARNILVRVDDPPALIDIFHLRAQALANFRRFPSCRSRRYIPESSWSSTRAPFIDTGSSSLDRKAGGLK